jgi:small ligand-binding sensory domain FIST
VSSREELNGLLRNMTAGLAPPGLMGRQPEPQDFLIRQVGFDNGGNMVVGDVVRPGQQMKFMVGGAAAA